MANLEAESIFQRQEELAVQIAEAKQAIDQVQTDLRVLSGVVTADLVASLAALTTTLVSIQGSIDAIETGIEGVGKPLVIV